MLRIMVIGKHAKLKSNIIQLRHRLAHKITEYKHKFPEEWSLLGYYAAWLL
jgi:hypothetical protein